MKDENERPDYKEFMQQWEKENDCMKISNGEGKIVSVIIIGLVIIYSIVLIHNFL